MSKAVGVVRAHCEDCAWTLERGLDAAGLSREDNQEIAARAVRSHAFRCGAGEWGATATVEMDLTGGGYGDE